MESTSRDKELWYTSEEQVNMGDNPSKDRAVSNSLHQRLSQLHDKQTFYTLKPSSSSTLPSPNIQNILDNVEFNPGDVLDHRKEQCLTEKDLSLIRNVTEEIWNEICLPYMMISSLNPLSKSSSGSTELTVSALEVETGSGKEKGSDSTRETGSSKITVPVADGETGSTGEDFDLSAENGPTEEIVSEVTEETGLTELKTLGLSRETISTKVTGQALPREILLTDVTDSTLHREIVSTEVTVSDITEEIVSTEVTVSDITEEIVSNVVKESDLPVQTVSNVEIVSDITEEIVSNVEIVSDITDEIVSNVEIVSDITEEIVSNAEIVPDTTEEIVSNVEIVSDLPVQTVSTEATLSEISSDISLSTLLSILVKGLYTSLWETCRNSEKKNIANLRDNAKKELQYLLHVQWQLQKRVDTLLDAAKFLLDPASSILQELGVQARTFRDGLNDAGNKLKCTLDAFAAQEIKNLDIMISICNSGALKTVELKLWRLSFSIKNILKIEMEIENFRSKIRDLCSEIELLL